jgi:hypothetical protein
VNRVFLQAVIAGNYSHDATHVSADIVQISHGKAILYEPADEFLLALSNDLQKIPVILLKIAIGSRRRAI